MREWQQFLSQLEQELGVEAIREWVPRLARFDAGNLYLEARDAFQANWFEEHIRPRLKGLVNSNQRPIKVHLGTGKKPPFRKEGPQTLSFSADSLDPEMTLENFIPSEQNRIAYQLLAESSAFNPIYLYGPHGVGKTHLLMGAVSTLQKQGKRVFFVRAERFTEHVVQAIRLGQMQEFRKVYRDIDVLAIDDIHIFSRKAATQEEFFHTFNTLHTMGRLILLSANVPPAQLKEIEPRLISRFEWGIALDLHALDPLLILEKKAALWKMDLSQDLRRFLVEKFPRNPILALQALTFRAKGAPLNPLIAEKWLQDLLEREQKQVLTPEKIARAVASHYGVTFEDLLGKSQTRECVFPRQVAMYLCRKKLKIPLQKIGEFFCRDHSTVINGIQQIQKGLTEKKFSLTLSLDEIKS